MRKTLFSCVAAIAVFAGADSWGAGRDRPELRAALERADAPIEQASPLPASQAEVPTTDSGPAAASSNAPPPKGNPLWGIPLRALAATRERPLFSASRRPPAPVVPSAPIARALPVAIKAAEPERPPFALIGTVVSTDTRIAILLNQTTKLVTQVREGEQESGWRLTAVSPRSTVVERDDQSVTLALPRPGNEGAQTEAATQAAPLLIRARAR